jgi:DNA-binding NarL/FixJ family response regulator
MIGANMFNFIVTILELGVQVRKIARDLKIDRNTIRNVQRRIR